MRSSFFSNYQIWIGATFALASLSSQAIEQNLSLQVTDTDPLGLGAFVPNPSMSAPAGKLKGVWNYGIALGGEYNSNFFLTENNEEDEFSGFAAPWIRYSTDPEGEAKVVFIANYTPVFRGYIENSELNDVDHSGDFAVEFRGAKTEISLFGRYHELSSTDRLTGDFVTGTILTGGIRANRQIASKTTLLGSLTAATSDYDSSINEGSDVYTAQVGFSWQSSARTSIGPALRYAFSESENTGHRNAWALMLDFRYQVDERIWIAATIGPEYSWNSESSGGNETSFGVTGDINARYIIDEWWTWHGGIRSTTIPSPSERNYLVNDVAIFTELQRELLYGWVSGGLEYHFSNYKSVGDVDTARSDENNLAMFLSYHRRFFADRLEFETTVRQAFNDGLTDWNQFTVTAGLNVDF